MLSNILLPPTEQNVIIPRMPASVLPFTRYSSEPPQTRSTLTNGGQWFPLTLHSFCLSLSTVTQKCFGRCSVLQ